MTTERPFENRQKGLDCPHECPYNSDMYNQTEWCDECCCEIQTRFMPDHVRDHDLADSARWEGFRRATVWDAKTGRVIERAAYVADDLLEMGCDGMIAVRAVKTDGYWRYSDDGIAVVVE